MAENTDFGILIIDDNPEIHRDFIKILTSVNTSSEFENIEKQLFGDANKASPAAMPTHSNLVLPKFKIDTASQGQEGVERILAAIKAGKPYALAFVDIRMPPGWDGIETIKHIWEHDKDIQIVICTAYSDYSWKETIQELGQTDNLLILKKPFDHIAVRQLACALTRKWKLMQEARAYTYSLEEKIKERTEELQYQATHDALTGLPNRVLLEDRINQAILDCERSKNIFAVLFFDLDRFKLINDSLNHSAGDELLRAVSKRIQSHIRATNTIARIGGDEFIVVLRDFEKPDRVASIAAKLLQVINQPLSILDHDVTVSSSMGIAFYPQDGKQMEELVRNADTAMYKAKEAGGNQFHFYTAALHEESMSAWYLENELRQAIVNQQFFVCYQPQFDIKTQKLVAVEALVRWHHPTRGVLLPMDFIPLAEETGLIIPIGEIVLKEACKQCKEWQKNGLNNIRVAVNITTKQLRQYNFAETIRITLKEVGLEPKFLELELTENTIVNSPSAIKDITSLHDLGISIALDDFGTGYSSLNCLRNIPLDRLKIDRSFVENVVINHGDEVLVQAIIAMAKGLNLEVLAEGVENQNQLDFLRSNKCSEIQGFYFSKPLTANELMNLLKEMPNIEELIKAE